MHLYRPELGLRLAEVLDTGAVGGAVLLAAAAHGGDVEITGNCIPRCDHRFRAGVEGSVHTKSSHTLWDGGGGRQPIQS